MTTTQQTTQHKVDELLHLLEQQREEAEKIAEGDGGTYFFGKESGIRAAIDLVKRLRASIQEAP